MDFIFAVVVAFLVLAAIGIALSVISLVLWLIFLPFQILGLAMKGAALLFALPFLAIFALVGFLVFGFGLLVFAAPLLPLVALIALVWWLVRRPATRSASTVS